MRDHYDFSNAKRARELPALARIQKENESKERITIRLDADVLAWFRDQVKGGGNYQTLINEALKAHIGLAGREDAPLTVRKLREVLRQELRAS
ncbi:BrnA antitoxin family protein [Panacagrimonas sp.]|uniref:BrnA antitoxin family protein n=1 Tax=Panacagrimonas sp. TaxID=2480088 RepID=UPI003B51C3B3